jgi:hypothetical protein
MSSPYFAVRLLNTCITYMKLATFAANLTNSLVYDRLFLEDYKLLRDFPLPSSFTYSSQHLQSIFMCKCGAAEEWSLVGLVV